MAFRKTIFGGIALLLIIFAGSCKNPNNNDESKKVYKAFNLMDIEALNNEIKANDEINQNPYGIAMYYYSTLYENYKLANITANTTSKYGNIIVEIIETKVEDVDIEAIKVKVIFDRPMGTYHVREIRHSWKCKNPDKETKFSAENCN